MDNRRLILLLVFSFSLVMLWDGWQKHNQPKAPATAAAAGGTRKERREAARQRAKDQRTLRRG